METSLSSLFLKNQGGLSLQSSLNRTDNKAETNKAGFTNVTGNDHGNTIDSEWNGFFVSKVSGSQGNSFDHTFSRTAKNFHNVKLALAKEES